MRLNFGIENSQIQKLHLTKELRQAIEILQMSSQEIESLISEEVDSNPLLDEGNFGDIDWTKFVNDIKNNIRKNDRSDSEQIERDINPNNFLKEDLGLHDYAINEVLNLNFKKDYERDIAIYIAESLNSNGYFTQDISYVASLFNVEEKFVNKILDELKTIEPLGLFAKDYRECLILQVGECKNREIVKNIIIEDLELIAQKKYQNIQKKYKISQKELSDIITIIKNCNPKPGKKFTTFKPAYIIPDIIVEKSGDKFEIINNRKMPTLNLSDFYQSILNNSEDKIAREYVKDKLNRATNLIKNIEQRSNTINKVAMSIIEFQKSFFLDNTTKIVPMKLKDISDKTGFHESTISRAVNGKYMYTPRGIFELRYFFVSSVEKEAGDSISSLNIKEKIKKIISEENKKKPYSDSEICKMLNDEGIQISRRTVAKYREESKILNSSLRKEI